MFSRADIEYAADAERDAAQYGTFVTFLLAKLRHCATECVTHSFNDDELAKAFASWCAARNTPCYYLGDGKICYATNFVALRNYLSIILEK